MKKIKLIKFNLIYEYKEIFQSMEYDSFRNVIYNSNEGFVVFYETCKSLKKIKSLHREFNL